MSVCGRERSLRLFEVLTRNRQSAVELFGRSRSAQQRRTHRVFTIPPRQRLSSPTRLVSRRRIVTHIRRGRRRRRRRTIRLDIIHSLIIRKQSVPHKQPKIVSCLFFLFLSLFFLFFFLFSRENHQFVFTLILTRQHSFIFTLLFTLSLSLSLSLSLLLHHHRVVSL